MMSDITPKVQYEDASLTSRARSLSITSSFSTLPVAFHNISGSRWLSLSPYKRAMSSFHNWDRITEMGLGISSTLLQKTDNEKDLAGSVVSHQDVIEHEEGSENYMVKRVEDRILGALRCYMFNLGMGTLVTDDNVDAGVASTLEELVVLAENAEAFPLGTELKPGLERGGKMDLKDEERLVMELQRYLEMITSQGGRPVQDIVEVSKEILGWAREPGTSNREDCSLANDEARSDS